jgi:hypothetical protein
MLTPSHGARTWLAARIAEIHEQRMHRSAIAWFACLVLAVGCSEFRNSTGVVSKRIGEVVHTPGTREVDLAALTTFGWDRFHIFRPGTTREQICDFLRAGRNVCGRIVRIAKAPDDHMFLVFGLGNQLTHIELHALENGVFDLDAPPEGIARTKSVFKIRRDFGAGKDRIWLEPA